MQKPQLLNPGLYPWLNIEIIYVETKITDIRNILQRVGVSDECIDVAVVSLCTQVKKLKSGQGIHLTD